MAISLETLRRGPDDRPPRMLIYGVGGVGKTRLASEAPSPVFLQTEEGEGVLDIAGWRIKSFADVLEAIGVLYQEDHGFKTVVIDSVDWLEPQIWEEACKRNNWKDIEQPGYGKGYVAALDVWREYLDGLAALRNERGMTLVQIAHAQIKPFQSPEFEPFDRFEIKLHKGASALLHEHSDLVGFLQHRISTVKTDTGFNKKAVRAVGGSARVLYTGDRPAFVAKNRYSMPDAIDLPDSQPMWPAVAQFIPHFNTKTQEAA